jgi:hypothetical protein
MRRRLVALGGRFQLVRAIRALGIDLEDNAFWKQLGSRLTPINRIQGNTTQHIVHNILVGRKVRRVDFDVYLIILEAEVA